MLASKIAMAAAGLGGQTYVEDVFSAYTYTGDGSTPTITNGLAMSDGSMVWIKNRDAADSHVLVDTTRGVGQILSTNTTAADTADADTVTAFSSTGFTLGADVQVNTSTEDYVAWSFRQADNFFFEDEVTKVASTSKTVDLSSLGTVGMVWVKRTDSTGSWYCWHRSLTSGKLLYVEQTAAEATLGHITVSGTTLTLVDGVIADGDYIVYAWAHDAGGFGADGSESIINCGDYTGNGTVPNATTEQPGPEITLSGEPQFLMIKNVSAASDWYMFDVLRGLDATFHGGGDYYLRANLANAESALGASYAYLKITATGFKITAGSGAIFNENGNKYAFMAIRRPMKVPEAGTEVFKAITTTGTDTNGRVITGVGFSPDLIINCTRTSVLDRYTQDRLRGLAVVYTNDTAAEATAASTGIFAVGKLDMDGFTLGTSAALGFDNDIGTYVFQCFKRAPEFMDVVCDTGTGSAHTVTHNLTVAPELMIRKKRSAADAWVVYANADPTDYLVLNTTAATVDDDTIWNDTAPTSSVFTVGTHDDVNGNTATFVTYLFATLAGISKVGSYTGTAASLDLDMGFAAGARFFLCKRTDSTGDWYVYDSERGIVAGNDPYLLLNSSAAEVTSTDYVDPLAAGLTLTAAGSATININTATYIYIGIS